MNIEEFYNDIIASIEAFRAYWLKNNKINPIEFPLNIPESNSGIWYELFNDFDRKSE